MYVVRCNNIRTKSKHKPQKCNNILGRIQYLNIDQTVSMYCPQCHSLWNITRKSPKQDNYSYFMQLVDTVDLENDSPIRIKPVDYQMKLG